LRQTDLDLYLVKADGSSLRKLYDSGAHDADIDWVGNRIVFTSNNRIWMIQADGTNPAPVTQPPRAGEWGKTNLPFGDYDPRLSPDGNQIVFERLEGDDSPHGKCNLFLVNTDGGGETRLTNNGYSQGLASWSHAGDKLVYTVAAVGDQGQYDLYIMNSDGTYNHNITPNYFPDFFLAHAAIFSLDDTKVYFIGEWWK
jgi:TolB protein